MTESQLQGKKNSQQPWLKMNAATNPHFIDSSFVAPTSHQVKYYLRRHALREPSRWLAWGPIAALAGLLMLSLMSNNPMMALVPWVGAGGILFGLAARVQYVRRLGQRVVRSQELAVLRHWPVSLRMCWRLLPTVVGFPSLHSRVVAIMAICLDQVKAYDAAVETYDYLLDHFTVCSTRYHPATHPLRHDSSLRRTPS